MTWVATRHPSGSNGPAITSNSASCNRPLSNPARTLLPQKAPFTRTSPCDGPAASGRPEGTHAIDQKPSPDAIGRPQVLAYEGVREGDQRRRRSTPNVMIWGRPSTVAGVGLGGMGSRMARRLLGAGYQVIVWNRSREKTLSVLDLGALPVHTPAEAAARAEVVITMVSDPEALRDVTEGPAGIAAGAGTSSTVVEMSTVGPVAI